MSSNVAVSNLKLPPISVLLEALPFTTQFSQILYTFFVASALQVADIAGYHLYTLADLGYFQVNLSTVLLFAYSVSAAALIKARPQMIEKLGEASDKLLEKTTHVIKSSLKGATKRLNPYHCMGLFGRLRK